MPTRPADFSARSPLPKPKGATSASLAAAAAASGGIARFSSRLDAVSVPGAPESRKRKMLADPLGRKSTIDTKSVPYDTTSVRVPVRLNRRVHVPEAPEPQDDPEHPQLVECRHFAQAFADHVGKKSELTRTFSTEDGIRGHFSGKLSVMEASIVKTIAQAARHSKHLVDSEHLGRYLSALACALETQNSPPLPSEANALLLTATHVMAVHVEHKCKDGVPYFSAKLFDPNATNSFKRVEAASAQALEHLTLGDMLVVQKHYGAPGQSTVAMAAICLEDDLRLDLRRGEGSATVERMHIAVAAGVVDELQAMLHALTSQTENVTTAFLFSALKAVSARTNTPGLFMALQDGLADSVRTLARAVKDSKLSLAAKFELFTSKTTDGQLGLFVALQGGHAESVKAMLEVVTTTGLSEDMQAELLAAKNNRGYPGLYAALACGHAASVRAFVEGVTTSGLPQNTQVELLAAMGPDGISGLSCARKEARIDAEDAFYEALMASALPADKKEALFRVAPTATSRP